MMTSNNLAALAGYDDSQIEIEISQPSSESLLPEDELEEAEPVGLLSFANSPLRKVGGILAFIFIAFILGWGVTALNQMKALSQKDDAKVEGESLGTEDEELQKLQGEVGNLKAEQAISAQEEAAIHSLSTTTPEATATKVQTPSPSTSTPRITPKTTPAPPSQASPQISASSPTPARVTRQPAMTTPVRQAVTPAYSPRETAYTPPPQPSYYQPVASSSFRPTPNQAVVSQPTIPPEEAWIQAAKLGSFGAKSEENVEQVEPVGLVESEVEQIAPEESLPIVYQQQEEAILTGQRQSIVNLPMGTTLKGVLQTTLAWDLNRLLTPSGLLTVEIPLENSVEKGLLLVRPIPSESGLTQLQAITLIVGEQEFTLPEGALTILSSESTPLVAQWHSSEEKQGTNWGELIFGAARAASPFLLGSGNDSYRDLYRYQQLQELLGGNSSSNQPPQPTTLRGYWLIEADTPIQIIVQETLHLRLSHVVNTEAEADFAVLPTDSPHPSDFVVTTERSSGSPLDSFPSSPGDEHSTSTIEPSRRGRVEHFLSPVGGDD